MLSCVIIMTTPKVVLDPIHNRMPVILVPEAESVWLDSRIVDAELLTSLLVPYPADMEAYEVSALVNSPSNDPPEVVARSGC